MIDLALRMVICNPPPEEAGTDIPDGYGTRSYAVVLLDEIDLHLHPSWQHIVLRGLLDAFPNAQFFVTTHSEQVLSSVDSTEEALVLMVGQEEGAVQLWSPPLKPFGARSQDIFGGRYGYPGASTGRHHHSRFERVHEACLQRSRSKRAGIVTAC